MNEFLLTRKQIDQSTAFLEEKGLVCSGISAKNWEITQVIPHLKNGDLIDLGSDGSVVIPNAVRLGLKGRKVGIDLAYTKDTFEEGVELYKGDLMDVPFEDKAFDIITSLSVLEHAVDYEKFAKETSRLLRTGGDLFVSFDYAPEKIDTSLTKLYSLDWNILSTQDVLKFVAVCWNAGLGLSSQIDWTIQDMVINPQYCSPAAGVEYTFGILHFIKR